jgi:hypothetical protein
MARRSLGSVVVVRGVLSQGHWEQVYSGAKQVGRCMPSFDIHLINRYLCGVAHSAR